MAASFDWMIMTRWEFCDVFKENKWNDDVYIYYFIPFFFIFLFFLSL